ncbi:MAG TPA: dethiobiotin synthase [Xanthobacteraceae bacterium]|nr:dethiobiotin synthase [Xanthobacteraceae bacterium]
MSKAYIVTGTDTGIGKTTVAAMLVLALDAVYWKPIQSGTEEGTDRQRVQALTQLPDDRLLPERYVLSQPLSPHRAAELDGIEIKAEALALPAFDRTLVIEGAGGLMVPVTRNKLQIDVFADWSLPIILCARTALGTINHTLLSIEALRGRHMRLHGLIFVGDDNPDNMRTIADFSGARILGHVPRLDRIGRAALLDVFARGFRREDFA